MEYNLCENELLLIGIYGAKDNKQTLQRKDMATSCSKCAFSFCKFSKHIIIYIYCCFPGFVSSLRW